ncbi:MAG: radical SAM protein [Desulfobacterales bacterium]
MKKPYIIPIFIPQAGCPHNCVFCNQHHITGIARTLPTKADIFQTIHRHLAGRPGFRAETQIAFFGGNFLGLPEQTIHFLLETVAPFTKTGAVHGIRCSTRPDTVRESRLALIAPYPFSTVEIGAQSMDDEVLRISGRGHTPSDTVSAVHLLRRQGLNVGLQIMVGLPGDDEPRLEKTLKAVISLRPDFVRIYPTLVFSRSLLARWYKNGRYTPLSLEESVSRVKGIYTSLKENDIPVIRMGLQPTPEMQKEGVLIAGPYHPSFGHLVYSEMFLDRILEVVHNKTGPADLTIRSNPSNISKIRGLNNRNIAILMRRFGPGSVRVIPDDHIDRNTLWVNRVRVRI